MNKIHKYPKYQVIVDGQDKWLSIGEAGAAYDCGWVPVELGKWVIDSAGATPRLMTSADAGEIREAADRNSENK